MEALIDKNKRTAIKPKPEPEPYILSLSQERAAEKIRTYLSHDYGWQSIYKNTDSTSFTETFLGRSSG